MIHPSQFQAKSNLFRILEFAMGAAFATIQSPCVSYSQDATPPEMVTNQAKVSRNAALTLPSDAGQYWMEYDLRPYTSRLKNVDRPQQALLDWILRDTGTDVWFNEPAGVLTADRSTLRVYHNEGMQKTVQQVYEKFVNGTSEPQTFALRIIMIGSPAWRQRAMGWMKPVEVQAPGVSAWLLTKENSALLGALIRSRNDVVETALPQITLFNGQSSNIEQLRSRNYVREYTRQEQPYPVYIPVSDEIQEGYKLQFSPLLSTDMRAMDVSLKCSIDQVERLNNVPIDLPAANGTMTTAQINVPQLVSWRMHERFRWPTDQVLMLSCGVIAAPNNSTAPNSLFGSPAMVASNGILGLGKLLPNAAGTRSDALLVMEYIGPAAANLTASPTNQTVNTGSVGVPAPIATNPNTSSPISRGRY
ncbi:MAG: hypothetical protein NTW52_03015 [Planctomycetota bacterium]|nr:hypothetical protein [Planctomycetota bacterium]